MNFFSAQKIILRSKAFGMMVEKNNESTYDDGVDNSPDELYQDGRTGESYIGEETEKLCCEDESDEIDIDTLLQRPSAS